MWAGGERRREKPWWASGTSGAPPQSSLRLVATQEEEEHGRGSGCVSRSERDPGSSLFPISFRAAHSHVDRAGGGVNVGGEPLVTAH